MIKRSVRVILALIIGACLVSAAEPGSSIPTQSFPLRTKWKQSYVRPAAIPTPTGNAITPERELLGRTLFFDPRLSGSGILSCASCHNPGFSWSDGLPTATGDGMKTLPRHSPTILNSAWNDLLFWDGRAESLEEQALGPIQSQAEMNLPISTMLQKLKGIPQYQDMFARAYPGQLLDEKLVAKAIATFERTVVSEPAPFDLWIAGDETAISESAKHGFDLFNSKAGCAQCHAGWNFTDSSFHDIGVASDDRGRGKLLPLEAMQFAFKTPTLRNIDRRAPYLHNGSEKSLEDVVEFYNQGGKAHRPSLAPEVRPLQLSSQEKKDIVAFLQTVTSNDKPVVVPSLPR